MFSIPLPKSSAGVIINMIVCVYDYNYPIENIL